MMRGRRALHGLDQDIRDHIERETQENIEKGMVPEEARRQALLKFGNLALTREDTRAVWVAVWWEHLIRDVLYTLRTLHRNPGFAAVVILTLALGIGLNTAVFSVFNAVLLRPLPYPDAERLIAASLHGDTPFNAIPMSEFEAWREQATAFERMAAYESTQDHTLQTPERGTQVRNAWVTDDVWALTGAQAVVGRLPMPGESNVIVLSYEFFEGWFQGDPAVVGQTVTLNGRQVVIAGVLSQGFRFHFPQEALGPTLDRKTIDVYRPYGTGGPGARRRGQGIPVRVVAKLRQNLSIDRGRAELETIRARLAQTSPEPSLDRAVLALAPLQDRLVGESRRALWVLLIAVACVLLIACANVGNLLLARATARQRELAVRVSLGGGRARVVRQLLTESLVLVFLGGVAGVMLARWSLEFIVSVMPAQAIPRLADVSVDGRVLAFAAGMSIVTALLFGLLPARVAWTIQPLDALRSTAQTLSATAGRLRGRYALVAAELALAVVLLTGAGLMVKSFWRMYTFPPGFHPERNLTVKVMFTADYLNPARRLDYVDEFLRTVRSMPDVDLVGMSAVGGASPLVQVTVEGQPVRSTRDDGATTHLYAASADYGRAMGVRLLRGRWFSDRESEPAAVVTASVARREFGDEDPIGRRIQLRRVSAPPGTPPQPSIPVVGVVSDLQYSRLDAAPDPQVFVPYRSYPGGFSRFTAVIRTTGDPLGAAPELRARIVEIDKTLPVFDLMTLESALADSIAPRRFNLFLLGTFAMAALLLAVIGVYGVMAYVVTQRVREIGIRLALGATRERVIGTIIRQGMTVAAAGIAAGVLAALALTELMSGLLYDVRPTDPATFVAATAVLAATALMACCVPALKAAFVDPAEVLKTE